MVLEVIFNLYFVQYVKYYTYNHDCRKLHTIYSEHLRSIQLGVFKGFIMMFLNAKFLQVIYVTWYILLI